MVTETRTTGERTKEDRARAWRLGGLKRLQGDVGRSSVFGGPMTDDESEYNRALFRLGEVVDRLIEAYSR